MIDFLGENAACSIFLGLGIISWILTAAARIESKKSGRYVSGIPAVGGILIIIGFLLSTKKWLAILGLLDFDLLYLIVRVIPDIIKAEIEARRAIPPDEFDDGTVIEYSNFNKEFEELRFPTEYAGNFEVHRINRYVIVKKNDSYFLLKTEYLMRIIERIERKTADECRKNASRKAKWTRKETQEKEGRKT